MSVEVVNLGCRLNLAEAERMRGLLAGADDLVVVNSCAVTAEAVRQTRQAIRRARRARPDARLLVTGCAAEVEREALSAMPEVDGLVPNAAKLDVRSWNVPAVSVPVVPLHSRGFVAVQNGCDHGCTFCIIPQGRGANRSTPADAVIERVRGLVAAGHREVVLTGVDLTSYVPSLGTLVERVLADTAVERLRLSSLDSIEIDERLFALIYTIDAGDDPWAEETWIKANPS